MSISLKVASEIEQMQYLFSVCMCVIQNTFWNFKGAQNYLTSTGIMKLNSSLLQTIHTVHSLHCTTSTYICEIVLLQLDPKKLDSHVKRKHTFIKFWGFMQNMIKKKALYPYHVLKLNKYNFGLTTTYINNNNIIHHIRYHTMILYAYQKLSEHVEVVC